MMFRFPALGPAIAGLKKTWIVQPAPAARLCPQSVFSEKSIPDRRTSLSVMASFVGLLIVMVAG